MIRDRSGKVLSLSEAYFKLRIRLCNYTLDFFLMCLYCVGNVPFHHVRRFFYRFAGMKIGKGSTIHTFARFYDPRNITIGEDTIIGDHVFLDGRDSLYIGNHVDVASYVLIYNSEHDYESDDFHARTGKVIIEDYVFIGPRVIILPGVTIGKGTVVGAGAVVTKNIPAYSVVGGVPASIIKERKNKNLRYKLGRARLFQ